MCFRWPSEGGTEHAEARGSLTPSYQTPPNVLCLFVCFGVLRRLGRITIHLFIQAILGIHSTPVGLTLKITVLNKFSPGSINISLSGKCIKMCASNTDNHKIAPVSEIFILDYRSVACILSFRLMRARPRPLKVTLSPHCLDNQLKTCRPRGPLFITTFYVRLLRDDVMYS